MNEFEEIIKILSLYKKSNPELRFGQILFNLGVNQFNNIENPEKDDFLLKDIHSDSDEEILKRILKNINKV
jgi:hypothetical protein